MIIREERIGGQRLILGDCLQVMQDIPDGSVDMVCTDPPYGTTACKWDAVIPFEPMWAQLKRITKPNGAIVLTASQPFTSALIMSNVAMFKYCWVWEKSRPTGFANAKKQPLRCVEDVLVFCKLATVYNPQNLVRVDKIAKNSASAGGASVRGDVAGSAGRGKLRTNGASYVQEFTNYPRQVLEYANASKTVHPTQKPVALMEYLIRTYTNAGETVLDFTMGSATTGVAAANTGRRFIGIEMDADYFAAASKRISDHQPPLEPMI